MKKITVLMLHLNYGGLEKQVTTLLNALADKYDIEIISVYDLLNGNSFYNLDNRIKVKFLLPFGPNKKEIKEAIKHFKVLDIFKQLTKLVKILYTKYVKVGKEVKRLNTDILISSRIEFSKQIKRKDIVTISQEHSYIDTPQYMKKVRKSFKNINYLIVMTNKAKENYDLWLKDIKLKPEVVVIPNMIKQNVNEKISSLDNNQIISIGRLEPVKDFETLIIVFDKLAKKNTNLTLKIIGEGSKRQTLEELIEKYGLKEKVILTGRLNENQINDELLKSDIFVLTSKSESFSLVLCEAMNCGLPCVSFDIDAGPREIIQNDVNGYLVDERNIESMVDKISKLIEDSSLREKMGQESYKKAKTFYLYNIIKKWEDLFI